MMLLLRDLGQLASDVRCARPEPLVHFHCGAFDEIAIVHDRIAYGLGLREQLMAGVARIARWIALALALAIAAVTLCPISLRPMTMAPAGVERAFAFALLGGAVASAAPPVNHPISGHRPIATDTPLAATPALKWKRSPISGAFTPALKKSVR
jgi:hypothetical protein